LPRVIVDWVRLLCPVCGGVNSPYDEFADYEGTNVELACGHTRPVATLPRRGVSFEDVSENRRLANRFWPASIEAPRQWNLTRNG
jgi:hypothetical protein